MTIDVLICTCGSGILKVSNVLTRSREDVRYIVSFQYDYEAELNLIPDDLLSRKDVDVVKSKSHGLSVNRNNALRSSKGDIILFADDDNRYTWGDFDRILYVFDERPDVDIVCFRSAGYDGVFCRDFPKESFNLNRMPHGYYVRSCEIAMRRRNDYPEFDEHFGLGSEYLACGEEEVFIHDALKQDFRIFYYPLTIVRTDSDTTGSQFNKLAAVRRSKGAVLAAIHGAAVAYLHVIKYAAFHVHGMSRLVALKDMCKGIAYAKKIGRC